jgi:glycosyltransferase involved in cell wall biosynthesis
MPLPATNWSAIRRTSTVGTRTLFSLRTAVAAFRPNVLHVQCFGPNGAYATALSRSTGVPLIVTLQGETLMDDADIFDTSRVLRASLRRGLRHAAAVTGCSGFTLADAETRFGLEPGHGQVIFNGVSLATPDAGGDRPARYAPIADQPDRPYVLALGRVVEKKGFDLLLEAFAAMATGRTAADLVIAGEGAARSGLQRRAEELGLADQVHFPGRLSRDEVSSAMAGATVFVMPSRLEPFGIVVLEAWRAGVAVMATKLGGPPEFVRDGLDGVLVDPFDTAGFATTLESLLLEPDRRRAIAASGRQRVAEFGWPIIAERYRSIYASVTDPGGAPVHDAAALARSHPGEAS